MNGPEHYAEAERLAEMYRAGSSETNRQWAAEWGPQVLAAAQVHATLAAAAMGPAVALPALIERMRRRGGAIFRVHGEVDPYDVRIDLLPGDVPALTLDSVLLLLRAEL